MNATTPTPPANGATGQTSNSNIQHLISDNIYRSLNTLKDIKVEKVRSALHDMFIEFNSHTPGDDSIRAEVTLIYVTLLQLCDGLAEGGIVETSTLRVRTPEKEILKSIYELFESNSAKGYGEALNLADFNIRESVGKDGGVFPDVADNTCFSFLQIKDFLAQLEVLKLEHTMENVASRQEIRKVENEILEPAF